jgi:oxygen-dependent protoporphyrinogen oxidase
VYAGDPERLEAASVLPMLAQAEREHGSVIRGMIAARKAARAAGTAPGRSITFRDGLGALAAGLERSLGDRVRAECAVSWMEPYAGGVCLGLEDGSVVRCERAVVATPARAAAALLQGFDGGEDVAAVLSRVPLAGLAVVGLGYDRAAIRHPLDGFGYLAAHGTGAPVLGCMFRSALFPQAAPEGKALLTVFIGGAMHPGAVDLDDAALVRLARRELAVRLGGGEPEEVFVKRWQRAIPQYERGHARLAAAVREWSARNAVSVIGNGVTGLSLPECIGAGRAEADRLMGVIGGSIGSGRRADACVPA